MAKKNVVYLEDDLTGGDASETITFALDGQTYEIDLNDENAAKLRDDFAPYIGAATKVPGSARGQNRRVPTPRGRSSSSADRERLADIRSWARENGYTVSDRGRIPGKVVEAYEAAHA